MGSLKDKGITAVNQDFSKYDQVKKEQTYHLAEGEVDEEFDNETIIKTCDIGQFLTNGAQGKKQFAQ